MVAKTRPALLRVLSFAATIWMAIQPATAAISARSSTDAMAVSLVTAEAGVPLDAATLSGGLHIALSEGWKTYWRSPGEVGIPPSIDWSGSLNVADVELLWPAPERFRAFGIENFGYSGDVVLPLQISLENPGEPVALRAAVSMLVCSKVCVPVSADLALDLGPGEQIDAEGAALVASGASRLPASAETSGVRLVSAASESGRLVLALRSRDGWSQPDVFPELDGVTFGPPDIRIDDGGELLWAALEARGPMPAAGNVRVTVVDGAGAIEAESPLAGEPVPAPGGRADAAPDWRALTGMLGLAFLGGLVLNAMPCVLPILGVKLGGALRSVGREASHVRLGFLASAAGVLTFMWVLAAGLIAARLSGASVGWGLQFQDPTFLAIAVLLLTLFAANALGLFRIDLPAGLADRLARSGGQGLAGDFAGGAFAALLATPCSAPFLGTAVAFALATGPLEIGTIFTALGLGLATPYLLVAIRPGLIDRLPRPGRWMVAVRIAIGVALAGTAAWLLWVLLGVSGRAAVLVVGALALLSLAVVGFGQLSGSLTLRGRTQLALLTVLMTVAVVAPRFIVPDARAVAPATGIAWQPFSRAEVAKLVSQGRTVFVDVTADWCVTCKANKALVLDRGDVASRLRDGSVVPLQADWTRPDPEIGRYLREHGRYGIPFNAVYGPGEPEGAVLPELLSSAVVLDAIDAAGIDRTDGEAPRTAGSAEQ